MYIKENTKYTAVTNDDIDQILKPILKYIFKKDRDNYAIIGKRLKKKCIDIGFILYNDNKKRRNINNFLLTEHSGLKSYIEKNSLLDKVHDK